ncbi:MAG: hypothetical protein RQ760_22370, partial [Sedimentisphaerales bacterium]|nr:hypothetical protein [Sedimentisphaerales bacterium]
MKMKKSLKVLCFVLPAVVALLIIAAIVINQFTSIDLLSTIQSMGTKALNECGPIFEKAMDFIIFCGRSIWNAYVKYVFSMAAHIFVTGLWYEVLIKVAGIFVLVQRELDKSPSQLRDFSCLRQGGF